MALKKRLRTEASLRPILAQYVPLELNTAEAEFSAWSRKFPSEGNGIPKVYVVRADGEVLYGKCGTPDELPKFLVAYRKQAGAILTAKQMKDLTAGLEKAKKAQADGDIATAMKRSASSPPSTAIAFHLETFGPKAINSDEMADDDDA